MKITFAAFLFFLNLYITFGQSLEERQFQLAQSYEQKGDFDGAARIYLELTKSNLQNSDYLNSWFRVVRQQNKYQELLDYLLIRIKQTPDFKTNILLGDAYWLKGFPEDADLTWKNAEKLAVSKEDYLFLAENISLLRQYDKAKELLLRARKQFSIPFLFSDELTKLYILLGDKSNGLEEILTNLKQTRNLALAQGRLYSLMLDDKSKSELDKILAEKYAWNKNDSYLLYLYIWFARTAGYYDKALDLTIDMDKLQNANYGEILRFANQCKNDGQHNIAIKAYTIIIEKAKNNPNLPSALYGLARTLEQRDLASDTISKENYEKVYSIYEKIIKDFPNSLQQYEGYYRLSKIAANNEKNNEKAIDFLQKITKKYGLIPVYIDAQFDLSDLFLKVDKLDNALAVLTNFISIIPKNEINNFQNNIDLANFQISRIYYFQDKLDSTKAYLNKIPQNSTSDVMNDILDFSSFINQNSNLNAAFSAFAKGELREFQSRYNEAINIYSDAAKLAQGNDLEETCYLKIAQLYSKEKLYEKSNEEYNSILDKFPNSINFDIIYFRMGQNFAELKKYDEAIQTLTKIIINYPKSIYFEDARKFIRELKDKEKAL